MYKLSVASLAVCALLASAAMAQPVNTIMESGAPPAPTDTQVTKDGKVCKILVVTGSRVPQQKICLTREEWKAKSDGAKEGLDALQRSGLTRNCIGQSGGGCGQ
ncbi:MAG: hypothetical protein Q7T19_11945 [Caulobacter sp.]|nr:hypothetical protein [Caulobacter sp.]